MSRPNVYADGPWDMEAEKMQIRSLFVGLAAGAKELGAVGARAPARARADSTSTRTTRSRSCSSSSPAARPCGRPSGDEQLEPGDVVSCPRGRDGMHTFANRTDEPARVLAISTVQFPDVVLYPEIGKFGVGDAAPVRAGARGRRRRPARPLRSAILTDEFRAPRAV